MGSGADGTGREMLKAEITKEYERGYGDGKMQLTEDLEEVCHMIRNGTERGRIAIFLEDFCIRRLEEKSLKKRNKRGTALQGEKRIMNKEYLKIIKETT